MEVESVGLEQECEWINQRYLFVSFRPIPVRDPDVLETWKQICQLPADYGVPPEWVTGRRWTCNSIHMWYVRLSKIIAEYNTKNLFTFTLREDFFFSYIKTNAEFMILIDCWFISGICIHDNMHEHHVWELSSIQSKIWIQYSSELELNISIVWDTIGHFPYPYPYQMHLHKINANKKHKNSYSHSIKSKLLSY